MMPIVRKNRERVSINQVDLKGKASVIRDFPLGCGHMLMDEDANAKEGYEVSLNEANDNYEDYEDPNEEYEDVNENGNEDLEGVDIGDTSNVEHESEGFVLLEDKEGSANED
ncbi:hypothetical protein L1987_74944 [Smallanthus sonchifolius]|uniref:Uncharacterized protein n=1 Tax=Smallanthus sonchifolius TaxID=185202 RepID=A0ACB9A3K8_9ASTR|nr:hypothetical protein L1987_74944 [Smallanthus sonchifolius]